jgi:hypothetical protein
MPALSDETLTITGFVDSSSEASDAVYSASNYLALFELIQPPEEATARSYIKLWLDGTMVVLDNHLRYLRTCLERHLFDGYRTAPRWADKVERSITRARTNVAAILDHFS